MTDSIIPEWVKQKRASLDAAEANATLARQTALLEEKIIEADGPGFWKQLLKELYITLASLSEIHLRGSLNDIGGKHPAESIQVYVSKKAHQAYTNLFYDGPGSRAIRCVRDVGDPFVLRLCVLNDKLLLIGDGQRFDAEAAANYIVQDAISQIG